MYGSADEPKKPGGIALSKDSRKGRAVLRRLISEEDFRARDAAANSFNREFQQLSEELAFATVWSRPGLDWKTRSLLCIAMLTALGHWPQLKMHANSALNNGATVEELKELVLHMSVYCGLPAAAQAGQAIEDVITRRGLVLSPIVLESEPDLSSP
ncbi:MAG: carboxymuconolactone decarboxylase family protein [Janthinobacterium lividum]